MNTIPFFPSFSSFLAQEENILDFNPEVVHFLKTCSLQKWTFSALLHKHLSTLSFSEFENYRNPASHSAWMCTQLILSVVILFLFFLQCLRAHSSFPMHPSSLSISWFWRSRSLFWCCFLHVHWFTSSAAPFPFLPTFLPFLSLPSPPFPLSLPHSLYACCYFSFLLCRRSIISFLFVMSDRVFINYHVQPSLCSGWIGRNRTDRAEGLATSGWRELQSVESVKQSGDQTAMRGPYVVLSPISKSHPFEERKAKVILSHFSLKFPFRVNGWFWQFPVYFSSINCRTIATLTV